MNTSTTSRASVIRKFGTAAFLFFLVKGLAWLVAAGALVAGAT